MRLGGGVGCGGAGCTVMRKCATTSTSRDFALWHSTKTSSHIQKKRGGGKGVMGEQFLVCKYGSHERPQCPRFFWLRLSLKE